MEPLPMSRIMEWDIFRCYYLSQTRGAVVV
jgi:hypothetical protein